MCYMTLEEILRVHFQLIEDFGGAHDVRAERRLLSVIEAPQQMIFGVAQYPTAYEKAAVYICNIVGDHPFADGNKRTAITMVDIFLARNGVRLAATSKELEAFVAGVATDHIDVPAIAAWLRLHS